MGYLLAVLVGFAGGLFTKNRYQKRKEVRYRENGKHEQ